MNERGEDMAVVNSILACKLYKSHKNQAKIIAAIQNPVNLELVQQLAEYLNEEDIAKLSAQNSSSSDGGTDNNVKTQIRESKGNPSSSAGGGVSFADDNFFSDDSDNITEDIDDDELVEDATHNPEDDQDDSNKNNVAESQNLEGSSVTGSVTLYNYEDEPDKEILSANTVEILKGTLNSRQDTAGVIRAVIKENELWLHYNDSINLNNVMVPVIDLMSSDTSVCCNFNRLARSENAIVFEFSNSSSSSDSGDSDE